MAGTPADKLSLALSNHDAIKQALIDMGQNPTDVMSTWPANIRAIAGNGGGGDFVVVVNAPLNIRIEGQKVLWDAVDTTQYSQYESSVKYYIQINSGAISETSDTVFSLVGTPEGEITVQIYAVLSVTQAGQSNTTSVTLSYVIVSCYKQLSNLSIGRQQLAGAGTNQYAVFAGGFSSGRKAEVDAYDIPNGGIKISLSNLYEGNQQLGGAGSSQYAVFAGGIGQFNSKKVEAYNMADGGIKSSLTALTNAKYDMGSAGIGDVVVFAGGGTAGGKFADVEYYNMGNAGIKGNFDNLHAIKMGLSGAAANNYVVFAGGKGASYYDNVEAYEATTGIKTSLGSLSIARNYASCAGTNGFVVFSGGNNSSGVSVSRVDAYDMVNGGVKTELEAMSCARIFHAGGGANGFVIFAGSSQYSYVDSYDMNNGGIKAPLTDLANVASNLACASAGDLIIFAGGSIPGGYSANSESYDTTKI
jgi:hypothetical protein